jgi:hypothetical protein
MMEASEVYWRLKKRIHLMVELGYRRFAICPMGQYGLVAKQILNWQYGIDEEMIIDNGLAKVNPATYSFADLGKTGFDKDIIVLLNSSVSETNAELYAGLASVLPEEQICNIMDPVIIKPSQKSAYFTKLHEFLRVADVKGDVKRVRIGRERDGGYVLLDDFQAITIAYSFGVGNDVSWDKGIASAGGGVDVFQYDPHIEELSEENEKFHFSKMGIGGKDDIERNIMSLESIVSQNGHTGRNDMILKMDIEGAEWGVLSSAKPETLKHFSQIVLELHNLPSTNKADIVLPALKKLHSTHQAVWVHANNNCGVEEAENIIMPTLLEVTFARRSDYVFEESQTSFPLDIDRPNIDTLPEIILGKWNV